MNEAIDISERNDPTLIPLLIMQELKDYVEHGVPTGCFLRAVISNNLQDAVGHADPHNIRILRSICGYIWHYFPHDAHGSREIYKNWIAAKKEEVTV